MARHKTHYRISEHFCAEWTIRISASYFASKAALEWRLAKCCLVRLFHGEMLYMYINRIALTSIILLFLPFHLEKVLIRV